MTRCIYPTMSHQIEFIPLHYDLVLNAFYPNFEFMTLRFVLSCTVVDILVVDFGVKLLAVFAMATHLSS